MYNPRRAAGIRTVAVLLAILSISAVANAKQQISPGTKHIRITSQAIKRTNVGTKQMMASALYNRPRYPHAIGNSVSVCERLKNFRTLPRGTRLCHRVFRFPLGQIVTEGIRSSFVYYRLAIVGGTGVYSNIGGQLQVTVTRLRPHRENLVFTVIAFKEET